MQPALKSPEGMLYQPFRPTLTSASLRSRDGLKGLVIVATVSVVLALTACTPTRTAEPQPCVSVTMTGNTGAPEIVLECVP